MGDGPLHVAPRRGARRGEARDSDVPTEFSYEIARLGRFATLAGRRAADVVALAAPTAHRDAMTQPSPPPPAPPPPPVLLWERTGKTTSELFCGTPALAVPAEQRPMVFLTFLMVLLIMKGRVHALSGNDYLYPFLLTYFVACILPDIHFAGYV